MKLPYQDFQTFMIDRTEAKQRTGFVSPDIFPLFVKKNNLKCLIITDLGGGR